VEEKPKPRLPIESETASGYLSHSQKLLDKGTTCYIPAILTVDRRDDNDEWVEMTVTVKRKDRREG